MAKTWTRGQRADLQPFARWARITHDPDAVRIVQCFPEQQSSAPDVSDRRGRDSGDAETWQRRSRSMPAFGPRGPVWRPADITTVYYKCHMELRASDHKPISALLLINLGFPLCTYGLGRATNGRAQVLALQR